MIVFREAEQITDWFVAFHTRAATWWVKYIPSKYKHVTVFGFSNAAKCWVFIDPSMYDEDVFLLPESQKSIEILADFTKDAAILKIKRDPMRRKKIYFSSWCVPTARKIIGLPGGALLPDGLWRDMIAQNAVIVSPNVISGPGPAAHSRA